MEWDAYYQMEQALGYRTLTDHWPVASTMIMGGFIKIGDLLCNSVSIGLFTLVIFQAIICIAIFAYSISFLKKRNAPKLILLMLTFWIGFSPIFPGFLTSVIKDTLFSASVTLSVILVSEIIIYKKTETKLIVITCIVLFLVTILRNNGIYIIIFWAVSIFVYSIKHNMHTYKKLMIAMLIPGIIYILYSQYLLYGLGIQHENKSKETFSIPFQQTARYLKYYPEDISEKEKDIIAQVLDINLIAEGYNPLLSDPVKDTFHCQDMKDLKNYFIVWSKMFIRHPNIYFDAVLCNTYGFFVPDAKQKDNFPNSGLSTGTISNDKLVFYEIKSLKSLEKKLLEYVLFIENNPFTYIFANVGIYMLLNIMLFIKNIYNKEWKKLILLIPSITGIFVCIASPTWWHNGFRYALPIICTTPFLIIINFLQETDI